jgi:hypothetical protein
MKKPHISTADGRAVFSALIRNNVIKSSAATFDHETTVACRLPIKLITKERTIFHELCNYDVLWLIVPESTSQM